MSERVAICVCTNHQTELLRICLESLAAQRAPDGVELWIVVVDAEAEMSARPIVNAFRNACQFPVVYVHQPQLGSEAARRTALDAAVLHACDWVAFAGDHEAVAPEGIAQSCAREEP
jgi:succinoglycan biosynthesis protein ExoM